MSLDSYYVWLQLRRFNDNSMIGSFLESIDRWMIPNSCGSVDKSWVTILLSVFDQVDTVQNSADVKFSEAMKRLSYQVMFESKTELKETTG